MLRVPNRHTNVDDQTIYAPSDGVILEIKPDKFPDGFPNDSKPAQRITIETRLTDAQLQTSPITGHIVENHLLPVYLRVGAIIQTVGKRHVGK